MASSARHRNLLDPFRLKHLTLRNRIVKSPYSSTNCDARGYVLDSAVYHYRAVASGGVGLFITESVAVDPLGVSGSPRMAIWDDSYIPGQRRLVEAVHRNGTPILMQLHHAGPSHSSGAYGSWSDAAVERLAPRAASSLTREQLPGPRPNPPQGLRAEEIADLVGKYARAAERAAEAGFDGVELHFAVSYLMNSFFSRAWNKRTDRYGGSLENRARFATEIVRRVRASVGNGFVVGARINGAEYGTRHGDGITYEESREVARLLERAGVDLLQVKDTGYNRFEWIGFPEQGLYPEPAEGMGKFVAALRRREPLVAGAEAVRKVVSIPVMTNGGLSFDAAERVLKEGRADLVAFARALIADPDAPSKLHGGRAKDIRPCTHCMTCVDAFIRSEHERCGVNAAYAKEKELEIVPAARRKQVLVVGGGPAGMEAARVAALRGHAVSLCERDAGLGGLIPLASLIKGTEIEDLPAFVAYLERQLNLLGVAVKRGQSVDAELVRRLAPDAVILATGARLSVPELPGIDGGNVVTGIALQARSRLPLELLGPSVLAWATKLLLPVGKRVVILGGLMQGVQLAEFLVKRGRRVVVAEPAAELGTGLLAIHRARLLQWLAQNGATLLAGVGEVRIGSGGVSLCTREGEKRFFEADTVIVPPVRQPDHALYEALKGVVPEVHLTGDCRQPGRIVDAVEGGYRAACAV